MLKNYLLIVLVLHGCATKDDSYSKVKQSDYNMANEYHSYKKPVNNVKKELVYLEDEVIYVNEVIYTDDIQKLTTFDGYEKIYYAEKVDEEKKSYNENIIYYYEEIVE